MNIKTKFNLGDKIFTLENKKVIQLIVENIGIAVIPDETHVRYECDVIDPERPAEETKRVKVKLSAQIKVMEEDAFATKKELLDSL